MLENDAEKVQSGLSLGMQAQTEWPGQVVEFEISGSTYHHLWNYESVRFTKLFPLTMTMSASLKAHAELRNSSAPS